MKPVQLRIHHLAVIACLGLVLGLLLAKFGYRPQLSIVMCSLALVPFMWGRRLISLIPVAGLFFCLGAQRGHVIFQRLDAANKYVNQTVKLRGKVSSDPVYHVSGQTEFRLNNATINNQSIPGTLRVRGFESNILRGDEILANGKLRSGYGPLSGSMSYASVAVVQRSASPLELFRRNFMARINNDMADPEAALGLGFLLGTRSIIPANLTQAMSATGLTHIVAVSGYNLTIIVNIVRRLFLRFSRFTSFFLSILLLSAFIVLAGGSPSIHRAAVVSILSLCAWYWGRSASPWSLLWFSAAITAYWQPLYLWGDIGWYLSFCAFFGVLILAPLVAKRVYTKKQPGILGSIVLETTMAQLATLPLIMMIFNNVSLVSLLANVLVLPLIPISMLLTFISGITGLLFSTISGWLAWPAYILLSYIVNLITLLARLPWALKRISLDTAGFVVIWIIIAAFWWGLTKFARSHHHSDDIYQTADDRVILGR